MAVRSPSQRLLAILCVGLVITLVSLFSPPGRALALDVIRTDNNSPTPIHISGTGDVGAVNIHSKADSSSAVLGAIPEHASPDYQCFTYGNRVNKVSVWFKVTYEGVTGYYPWGYDDAHYQSEAELTKTYGVPKCGGGSVSTKAGGDAEPTVSSSNNTASDSAAFYDRSAAVSWAVANYNHRPLIQHEGDCTWYVSQALWAGGLPTSNDWAKYSPKGVLGTNIEAAAKALYMAAIVRLIRSIPQSTPPMRTIS